MDEIPEIDVDAAKTRLDAGETIFMDVRDPGSFAAAHVPGARRVDDATIARFLEETDRATPIVVYCYHGHTSLGGAAFLLGHGFREVYSMRGGFEGWRARHEVERGD